MADAIVAETPANGGTQKSVWRILRDNPYLFGLSSVGLVDSLNLDRLNCH